MSETPHSADIPENELYWRQLGMMRRDIDEPDFDRQRESAVIVSRNCGIVKRFLEIIADFTVGEEPHPQAEDEALQEVLDEFWYDPVNDLQQFARQLVRQVRIIGEQIVTAHVRESDGRLRLGYLDPSFVGSIVAMPGNPRDQVEVWLKTGPGVRLKAYRILRPNEPLHELYDGVTEEGKRAPGRFQLKSRDPELYQQRDPRGRFSPKDFEGACFYWAINKLSNASRGLSDLFADIDFVEKLDGAVYDTAERAKLLKMLALDIETDETQESKLKDLQRKVHKAYSKFLGTFTHNPSVKVTASTPDTKSADSRELVKIILLHLLGSWGFPLHWFGDGGDANLATAGEMGGPTIRKLQAAQTAIRRVLRSFCDLQIALKKALEPERLSGVEDLGAYSIILPEIVGKDTSREAQALGQVTMAITQAVEEEWLTRKTGGIWWQNKAQQILGEEVRKEDRELLDKIDKEQTEEEQEPRPGDDGLEPDEDDSFEDAQKKPLPPAMKAQADKAQQDAEERRALTA